MKFLVITAGLALAVCAYAQTMTEFGAAAAAGTAGGVGGKGVSDGLNSIFGKVDQQTKAASKQGDTKTVTAPPVPAPSASTSTASPAPAPSGGSGSSSAPAPRPAPAPKPAATKVARVAQPKPAAQSKEEPPSVPDPPAPPNRAPAVAKVAPPPPPAPVVEPPPVAPPPPPPPMVTADDLKGLKVGTSREELLKMGAPAGQMTMFDDENRLLEVYSYVANGATFGVVRLNNGSVTKIELR